MEYLVHMKPKADVHIRIDSDRMAAIRELARRGGFKITWVIEEAIARGFDELKQLLAKVGRRS